MAHLVAPSLLSVDFCNMGRDIDMLNKSEADWLHLDIMDGVFVPNISFGQPVVKHIKKLSQKPLDVHLMIMDPDRYFEDFKACGADILSVHYEACTHLHRSLSRIRELGMQSGVVLNPHTSVGLLEDILPMCDVVMLMSVNPGFGGQKFIENTYERTSRLKEMIEKKNPYCLIEIDGGVNTQNAERLYECGADVLVAGSAVFASENPMETIKQLKLIK
ncbi:MAG: ribulose-phosphate 3-epimerase [Bacteroidales bacterium]|nr:ribulose-phosphate 3-epimerase [Bacteroidales bacterium]